MLLGLLLFLRVVGVFRSGPLSVGALAKDDLAFLFFFGLDRLLPSCNELLLAAIDSLVGIVFAVSLVGAGQYEAFGRS